jgi:hypothetical protein
MPKRLLKTPTNPEALGLLVSLLARYAIDAPNKTELERKFDAAVAEEPGTRATAQRLIDNFNRIPVNLRLQHLSDLATPKLTSFPQAQFEAAIKAMPVVTVNTVIHADDVQPIPLPPPGNELITLNFAGIYCSDDTDDQFFGNVDQIYVITNVVEVRDGTNEQTDTLHPLGLGKYEGVEKGEFRNGPLAACAPRRGPNIVSLVCTVMENDFGDPDHYKEEIALVVTTAFAVIGILNPGVKLAALLAAIDLLLIEAINWLIDTDDDMVGDPQTTIIEVDTLRRLARENPRLFVGKRRKLVSVQPPRFEVVDDPTEILHHFATTHSGGGKYNVCFRLKFEEVGVAPA